MVDRIEGFGEVQGHGHCTVCWWPLVETSDHFVYEWKEGGGGGAVGTEAVLGVG